MAGPTFSHLEIVEVSRLLGSQNTIKGKVIALGGQKMIGGPNCWLIEAPNGYQLMLDCGQQIIESDGGVIPTSAYPDFQLVDLDKLEGVVLTHGHFDHILGLSTLLSKRLTQDEPLKIWLTPTTQKVVERVMVRSGIIKDWKKQIRFNPLLPSQEIGDFHVDAYPINHSIPDASALVVEVGGKKIGYITDFKYMRSNWLEWSKTNQMFQSIGQDGLDVLILDASGMESEGITPSTYNLLLEFAKIFNNPDYADSRIIVSTFASNVETISDLATLANQVAGRPVECDGDAMFFFFDAFGVIKKDEQEKFSRPPVVFVTGCQAEEFSSLNRASLGTNQRLSLKDSDVVVIASRVIPGNRSGFDGMNARLNAVVKKVFITDAWPNIHVSGHEGCAGLRQTVYDTVPKILIPCHAGWATRRQLAEAIAGDAQLSKLVETKLLNDGQYFVF